jgi:hypothetical protein
MIPAAAISHTGPAQKCNRNNGLLTQRFTRHENPEAPYRPPQSPVSVRKLSISYIIDILFITHCFLIKNKQKT